MHPSMEDQLNDVKGSLEEQRRKRDSLFYDPETDPDNGYQVACKYKSGGGVEYRNESENRPRPPPPPPTLVLGSFTTRSLPRQIHSAAAM